MKSHALKRQLAREIAIKHKESANVFTEFKKNSDQFLIKRWAKRNNFGGQSTAQAKKPNNPEDTKTVAVEESKTTDAATLSQVSTQALSDQLSQMSIQSEEEKQQNFLKKEAEDLFVREMGFAQVVEELIAAKKPIIGHNMIYDIIYLYNQFIDDLPQTYPEFI